MATWIWVAFMFATGAIGLLCGYRLGMTEGRWREIHDQIFAANLKAAWVPKAKRNGPAPPPPDVDTDIRGGRSLEVARQELALAQWRAEYGSARQQ